MTIYYLMVKTHKITGLKYLCQTKQKNPYQYPGSGKYWERHIKVYGKQIDTIVLRECKTKQELAEWGLHYSNLWNVVESKEWANLMPETGDGSVRTPESIIKQMNTREKNGTINVNSPESILKSKQTKMAVYGALHHVTPESVAKQIETKRKNGTLNSNSPESIAKGINTKHKNGTLNTVSDESISKQIETKRKNGTLNPSSPESISKCKQTKLERYGTLDHNTAESISKCKQTKLERYGTLSSVIRVCCIHCKKDVTLSALSRYHGDKCKLKQE